MAQLLALLGQLFGDPAAQTQRPLMVCPGWYLQRLAIDKASPTLANLLGSNIWVLWSPARKRVSVISSTGQWHSREFSSN